LVQRKQHKSHINKSQGADNMFGIIAESLRTALLDNGHHGDWPRKEPGPRLRSDIDVELRRNPYVQYRDLPFRR
jgi:hypothetical protein